MTRKEPEEGSLGWHIRQARKKAKLSQQKLAERIGSTQRTVTRWELNQSVPNEDNAAGLLRELSSLDGALFNPYRRAEVVGGNLSKLTDRVAFLEERLRRAGIPD